MLDANSTIDDKDLATFVASCGLHDCHSLAPPPSTYIGSSNRRIDFIFGCDEALQLVIRGGILAYTEGPQSDHRGLYVDISPEFIEQIPWSKATPSAARSLHTGNPELVEKYNLAMLAYYGKHRMVERIEDLYQRHRQMSREDLRAALISWDNDQGRSMESSERLLKRPPQKCQWSPALRNSAILRRYWMLRLRELLHGKDFQPTFLRWQTQVQQSDSKFLLPSLGTRLSVDQIRHELTQANNRFRRLQKISTPRSSGYIRRGYKSSNASILTTQGKDSDEYNIGRND
ncbi:hypothetical protein MHU86_8197 [Fragilaria crotonensis]|nr:hypothetical protein MHU86_8197 [Fragilaria crotonensis]